MTEQPQPATPEEEQAFAHYRHLYLQVSSQGQNLLTASTFLTGLTFASFAMLLTASPITGLDLPAVANTLLGLATVLFLLTAISTFWALRRLVNVSPHTAAAMSDGLKNGEPAPLPLQAVRTYWAQQTHQAATPADVQPSTNLKRDLDSLTTAYTFYMAPMAPVSFMTVGFGLLLGGLLLIGWRLHLVIFLVLLVPLAYYAYMLTMRNR